MSDRERERIESTTAGQARLLAAIDVRAPTCTVDAGALGEYAAVLVASGRAAADAAFPETANHLRAGCATCTVDLPEIVALLAAPDEAAPPPDANAAARPESGLQPSALRDALLAQDGISLVSSRPNEMPPTPTPAASPVEPARQRRGLHLRDRLLIAAAVIVVVVGVALLGLSYFAAHQPAPAQPSSGSRILPTGNTCPAASPVKGNRESKIYHVPGGAFYESTRPEECFATPADAEAAGYRRSQR
jgi:hypothetical protein